MNDHHKQMSNKKQNNIKAQENLCLLFQLKQQHQYYEVDVGEEVTIAIPQRNTQFLDWRAKKITTDNCHFKW